MSETLLTVLLFLVSVCSGTKLKFDYEIIAIGQ